jgi:asparagine synthase (glutamine-hydrolysing)
MRAQAGIFHFEERSSGSELRDGRDPRQVLTWNGRLDNRDDLLLRVGGLSPDAVDSSIAIAAFERFGNEGLGMLIGEWSIAIWDRARRMVHLARDYMGARPLYYCVDLAFVAWSTELGELVRRCDRADALSDAFVARFLTLNMTPAVTPYERVHAVPPGTCVSFSLDGGHWQRRFWTLEANQIHYANRHRYEEHLRHLWTEAVAVRLRTTGTVWAELSGGLDSSSVVCMADWLLKSGRAPAHSIRMVSHVTLDSPEGDERRFIAEVERQVGVRSEIVGVEDHQEDSDPETAWVTPYASQGVGLACVRRVRDLGGCLVLSGRLGDAVMGCQPDNSAAVLDDFGRGRVLAALSNMHAWSRSTRKPFLEIAWRLLAPSAQPAGDGFDLLTAKLRAIASDATPGPSGGIRPSKRELARMVLGYSLRARLDVPYQPAGVIYTYPFSHRPLVEFMFAIPGEELSAPGETRSLMRRAFAGFVPARILRRISKGYYPPAAFRAARQMAVALMPVEGLEVVQRDWIDPKRLTEAVRVLMDGGGATGGDIHGVLRLERWLKARHRAVRIPQREEVDANAVLDA